MADNIERGVAACSTTGTLDAAARTLLTKVLPSPRAGDGTERRLTRFSDTDASRRRTRHTGDADFDLHALDQSARASAVAMVIARSVLRTTINNRTAVLGIMARSQKEIAVGAR